MPGQINVKLLGVNLFPGLYVPFLTKPILFMKKLFFVFAFFYGQILSAQTFINQYSTPGGGSVKILHQIGAAGGGYYMCGAEQKKGFVAKLDTLGGILWKKQYDSGTGTFEVQDLVESKNGTLIGVMNTVEPQNSNASTTVFKLSAVDGAVVWATRWSAGKTEFTCIEPSVDGYILAGSSFNNPANPSLSENQRLAKIDEDGAILWQKSFVTPFTKVRTLYTDAAGNAYVTGMTNGSSLLDEIFVFSPDGSLMDNFGYNANLSNVFLITAVRPLAGGDIIVASTFLLQGGGSVMVVFRIRSPGWNVVWSKSYRINGFNGEIVDMEQSPDGQLVALCRDRTAGSTAPVVLLKFKDNSSFTWLRTIDVPSSADMGTSLSITPDGYLEIVGSAIFDAQNSNGFFIRTDTLGRVKGNCPSPDLNVLVQNAPLGTNVSGYGNGGSFNRTVVNDLAESASELTRKLEVYAPDFTFVVPDSTCAFDCINITVNPLLADLTGLEWAFPGATPSVFSGPEPPPICYEKNGDYSIVLITSECDTVTRQIVVNSNLGVPNAFTPNDDGVNDRFRPLLDCELTSYVFEIYNRWGQRIFFTNEKSDAWDGTYLGANAPPDVYFWRLQYNRIQEDVQQRFSKNGDVTLIR